MGARSACPHRPRAWPLPMDFFEARFGYCREMTRGFGPEPMLGTQT